MHVNEHEEVYFQSLVRERLGEARRSPTGGNRKERKPFPFLMVPQTRGVTHPCTNMDTDSMFLQKRCTLIQESTVWTTVFPP